MNLSLKEINMPRNFWVLLLIIYSNIEYSEACSSSRSKPPGEEPEVVENLLVIGGWVSGNGEEDGRVSDVELVRLGSDTDDCDPADLGNRIYMHESVTASKGVLTCGGSPLNAGTVYTNSCTLQTATGELRSFPSMDCKRYEFQMVNTDDTIYAIGGGGTRSSASILGSGCEDGSGRGSRDTMEVINVKNGNQWIIEDIPFTAQAQCVVAINDKIVVIGGIFGKTIPSGRDTWIFDVRNKTWSQGPSLILPRAHHSCIVDQKTSTIYAMGGLKGGTDPSSMEKLKFDDINMKWEEGSDLPLPLITPKAVPSSSDKFIGYLVGGEGEIFDLGEQSKIWGLRRSDVQWVEMSKTLKMPRYSHTVIKVTENEIPGC